MRTQYVACMGKELTLWASISQTKAQQSQRAHRPLSNSCGRDFMLLNTASDGARFINRPAAPKAMAATASSWCCRRVSCLPQVILLMCLNMLGRCLDLNTHGRERQTENLTKPGLVCGHLKCEHLDILPVRRSASMHLQLCAPLWWHRSNAPTHR